PLLLGGLVARAACGIAEKEGHRWRRKLTRLVCLGAPHQGAALERAGHWVDLLLGISRYSAPLAQLGKIRSAGVTDLRYGNVQDADWQGRDRFAAEGDRRKGLPLPEGVACYAMAGTTTRRKGSRGKLAGDGLVSVDSALGRHVNPRLRLELPEANQWIAHDTGHVALLGRRAVYPKLRAWLR
ncbi:MAG TPA: alpha/beta hydrolase, partial [Myxococcaceae bacterium]|nr:alpha/beta hydrolase [Myxococcaceae bacterium]